MSEKEIAISLAVGLIPHRIERKCLPGGIRTFEVRAFFWSLEVRQRRSGRNDWTVRVPLIERLRAAALLHGDERDDERGSR
jgi:hypothetical protein